MSHLTNEEIQQFISFKKLSDENLKLAAKVNSHILECDTCLELVRELQEQYYKNRSLQEEKQLSPELEKDSEAAVNGIFLNRYL